MLFLRKHFKVQNYYKKEMGYEAERWMEMAQVRVQWRAI
jgi:hypothetical protein